MAKLKYRVRVLLGDQELVLLVPAAPATTVGELQADILARARRKGVLGSACELFVNGASLDELDSVEDVLEVEQTIDARLSPLRECSWSAADLAALVREGFSPALRHTIVETHASLAAFRRSPDGSHLLPSRVTPAKRSAPDADEDCVAAPAPADEDESDAREPADEDSVAAARASAARALHGYQDASARSALERAAGNDESARVRIDALGALLTHEPDAALFSLAESVFEEAYSWGTAAAATTAAAKAMVFMMNVSLNHGWRSVLDHADNIAGGGRPIGCGRSDDPSA